MHIKSRGVMTMELHLLRNRVLLMRHGPSKANKAHQIASKPENALKKFGLIPEDLELTRETSRAIRSDYGIPTAIYSSDFLRAMETAYIARKTWSSDLTIHENPGLRERDFGSLELESNDNYSRVWAWDLQCLYDAHARPNGFREVEHCERVAERMLNTIYAIDALHDGQTLLIISHGDPLDILLSVAEGRHAGDHRLRPFAPAECRPFPLSSF